MNIGAGAIIALAALGLVAWKSWDTSAPGGVPASTGNDVRVPQFIPTNGGTLTIAWVKGYESFKRVSPSEAELKLPAGMAVTVPLPFGDTVSEIRTAAKFQYQIRLEHRWPIKCTDAECVVRTGPLELAEPVAIYHDETARKTQSGWARFDKAAHLEELNRKLGAHLVSRGNEPRNRDLAIQNGRVEVEKFVREWMMKEARDPRRIVVLFPGEQWTGGKIVTAH